MKKRLVRPSFADMEKKLILKKVSRLVKQMRKEKGITQEDFLYDVGINISRVETGMRDIHCTTLIAICKRLCISPSEFFKEYEKIELEDSTNSDDEKTFKTKIKRHEKIEI